MRVGGSAWEFKIDPKRLRKKIKNDIEKRRKKGDEKKTSRTTKRAPKSFGTVRPGNEETTRKRKGKQFARPRPLGSPYARGLINDKTTTGDDFYRFKQQH